MRRAYYLGKVDGYGNGRKNCPAYFEWELKGGNFSMKAAVWRPSRSDIIMGGQCVEDVAQLAAPLTDQARRMVEVWRAWHLNNLKAGCSHQRAEGWDNRPIDPTKPTDAHISLTREGETRPYYTGWNVMTWIRRDEHPEGLLCEPCPTCGYRYGTAWLRDEIPADVIAEIEGWSTSR